MRICYINPFFYPFRGGIENRIYHVAKKLAQKHDVFILTSLLPGTSEYEEMDGIKIVRVKSFFLDIYNPPFVWNGDIRKEIEKIKPDVIDFHYRWTPNTTIQIANLKKYPKVFTYHNDFGEGTGIIKYLSYINDTIFNLFLKKFDKIICISEYIKRRLKEHGIEENKLTTIYNGIEQDDVGYYEKENYFLFVGRLVKTKGVDRLIRAMAMANIDAEIVIAGKGPMMEKWKSLAKKYGVKAIFPGWISEEEKIKLMKKSRAFVLPSVYESFGIVLLEAMKYGTPIIAMNTGGIPEVIGNAGMIVNNEKEMAEALSKIYNDDDLAKKLGEKAITQVKKFSWDKIAKETFNVYEEIVEKNEG